MGRAFFTALLVTAYMAAQFPPAVVRAQSAGDGADSNPPIIVHTPPGIPMVLDEPFLVHAAVSDDVAVAKVRLYFRAEGADGYRSIEMTSTRPGSYTATIPAHHRSDRAIEYFIQAEDTSGNIALRGAAFEPMRIADPSIVDPSLVPKKEEPAARLIMKTPTPSGKPWYKKWWVWTLAGAVIVGAAAGGRGGGGGDEPAPGTATITAPIP